MSSYTIPGTEKLPAATVAHLQQRLRQTAAQHPEALCDEVLRLTAALADEAAEIADELKSGIRRRICYPTPLRQRRGITRGKLRDCLLARQKLYEGDGPGKNRRPAPDCLLWTAEQVNRCTPEQLRDACELLQLEEAK